MRAWWRVNVATTVVYFVQLNRRETTATTIHNRKKRKVKRDTERRVI